MQAVGMTNDHLTTCPRHAELLRLNSKTSNSKGPK
jgi:hypothetical protein